MQTPTVEAEWRSFADAVLPSPVSPLQYREMKRAFFAGAEMLLTKITLTAGDHSVSEEEGEQMLRAVTAELAAFAAAVKAGRA